jgi:membrane protein implicated in regulation of membrane protease activity
VAPVRRTLLNVAGGLAAVLYIAGWFLLGSPGVDIPLLLTVPAIVALIVIAVSRERRRRRATDPAD